MVIHTVGHSNRSAEALLALLDAFAVEVLIDVRAVPRSRRHPQFERGALATALAAAGREYRWWGAALGGMRRARADSPHRALPADGLRGYADHMASPAFRGASRPARARHAVRRVALMCAEADFRHCHRQLIADGLVLAGAEVRHISAPDQAASHEFHPALCAARNPPVYNAGLSGDLFD